MMDLGSLVLGLTPKSIRRLFRESFRIILREELQTILKEEFTRAYFRNSPYDLEVTRLQGSVDHVDSEVVIGWAWDSDQPDAPVAVEIWDGGRWVNTIAADEFRRGLCDAGMGNGRHAFVYVIPNALKDGQTHSIAVKFSANKVELNDSPRSILLQPSSLESPRLLYTHLRSSVGPGPFVEIGKNFVSNFANEARLKPYERVLEIGCGIGRIALPLTDYLNSDGSYVGIDISSTLISWCRENITPQYPNFHFDHTDLFNKAYNPSGKHQASEYIFPYDDQSFDFIFLTSVFTHMLTSEMEHYMSEISRLLKKGGRSFITYFLINDESLRLIDEKKARWSFRTVWDHCRVEFANLPEAFVAYDEPYIRRLYQEHGLELVEPIHYGEWCGRKNWYSGQDVVIASKPL